MAIQIQQFRKYEKNSLQGFVTLLLTGPGLEIRDATYHMSNGKRWISLPSKPYQDKDGSTKYSYILAFPDKKIYAAFQSQAIEALDEYLAHHDQTEPELDQIPF